MNARRRSILLVAAFVGVALSARAQDSTQAPVEMHDKNAAVRAAPATDYAQRAGNSVVRPQSDATRYLPANGKSEKGLDFRSRYGKHQAASAPPQ